MYSEALGWVLGALMGLELVKSQGSPEKCEDLSLALLCLILLTWEVIVGLAHTGDARPDSAFKVVAELSVLRRVGEEAVLFAVDPGKEAGNIYRRCHTSPYFSPCGQFSCPYLDSETS